MCGSAEPHDPHGFTFYVVRRCGAAQRQVDFSGMLRCISQDLAHGVSGAGSCDRSPLLRVKREWVGGVSRSFRQRLTLSGYGLAQLFATQQFPAFSALQGGSSGLNGVAKCDGQLWGRNRSGRGHGCLMACGSPTISSNQRSADEPRSAAFLARH